jgi:hypothetical protein
MNSDLNRPPVSPYSKVFKIIAYFVLGGVIITSAYLLVVGVGFAIAHQNY